MNQPPLQRRIVRQTLPNLMLFAAPNLICRTKLIQTPLFCRSKGGRSQFSRALSLMQFSTCTRIQESRVSRFRFLGNALWDRRSRKVSTNSRISAITEYSFHLRICLPPIYAVFFHWNTSVTPFILVSNSINW